MTKLVCPECQHENELERIYCHNCGARLDRTSVIKDKIAATEPAEETQKRLQRLFDPKRGRWKNVAARLTKTLLGALCFGAVIVCLSPGDFPPEAKSYDFAPMINMDLVSASSSGRTAPLTYSEAQVNSYLASILRRKDSPAHEGVFPLRRVLVEFREGSCVIRIQRQFFGLSVYAANSYRVTLEGGKINAATTSAFIGRMPIHPALAKGTGLLFQKVWDTLGRERSSIAKTAAIEFHPQSVMLVAAH
ncbi:MAG TPA: hypothetical protein VGI60_15590 [Chthoniobacterales bacterium]|jgi:hypothetical protein